jgi:hypothetical protein
MHMLYALSSNLCIIVGTIRGQIFACSQPSVDAKRACLLGISYVSVCVISYRYSHTYIKEGVLFICPSGALRVRGGAVG